MLPLALLMRISAGLLIAATDEREPPVVRPLVTVRAVHPDEQLADLLRLFDGARASSPAAALAAWKRATTNPKRLGKTTEAIIATLNPRMVPELRSLDDAVVAFRRDSGSNRWLWRAMLPHDDGTIGAVVATTLLSGGRLGPSLPGAMGDSPTIYLTSGPAPILTRVGGTLALSNDPTQLAQVARRAAQPIDPIPWLGSGWFVQIDPFELADQFPTLAGRRVHEVIRTRRWSGIEGCIRLDGTTLLATTRAVSPGRLPGLKPIDPEWTAIVPSRGALAAWAVRLDPRPEATAPVFECFDRVERLDPDRARIAPSRLRLALLARAVGVRLDADLLPHLIGVAGWVGPEGVDLIGQGVVALYLDDEGVARRIIAGVRAARVPGSAGADDSAVPFGLVAGRPLSLHRLDSAVVLAWGDRAWATALDAREHPQRSARSWLGTSRSGFAPARAGAVWLDQALSRVPGAADLAASLAAGPPLRWAGQTHPNELLGQDSDEVWLDGLDGTVRRFLDRLPFNRPPSD